MGAFAAQGNRGPAREFVAEMRRVACTIALLAAGTAAAATVPYEVVQAVHGRVVGWTHLPGGWFAVYLDRNGKDFCGLRGAAWRIALVESRKLPVRTTATRSIRAADCGNYVQWVKAGRFSDGRHQEVAFMLWTTPAIGAWTYVYRVAPARLTLLHKFYGDSVTLRNGTATVGFENRGRGPHGELADVYRFTRGRYLLVRRR
jgi:hypothetical protein